MNQTASGLDKKLSTSLIIFLFAFGVFFASPVRKLGDNEYSVTLSQCLIEHRTFALDSYPGMLPSDLTLIPNSAKVKAYNLEVINGHVFYYFPPGGPVLSIPFVAFAELFGWSAVDFEGKYDGRSELKISSLIAALLMAGLGTVFFLTARLVLSQLLSVAVSITGLFGTQVWSNASRVAEQDTWAILLLALVLLLLFSHPTRHTRVRPILMATLLSWAYFCRPTCSVSIIAISVYMIVYERRHFAAYAITGAFWLSLLFAYSWSNFHQALPNYFQASRLEYDFFWTALTGDLISPSRGLLVFVPLVIVPVGLAVRYWKGIEHKSLVFAGAAVFVGTLITVSGFDFWWGGHGYGPRFLTPLVPWIVLLSVIGLQASALQTGPSQSKSGPGAIDWTGYLICFIALVSIAINARGALSQATQRWSSFPKDIDAFPERLWDWSYPQFMAGIIRPPLPEGAYRVITPGQTIQMTTSEISDCLWYGWSGAEPEFRWTDGTEAGIVFAIGEITPLSMQIKAQPFLAAGKVPKQTLYVALNGHNIAQMELTDDHVSDLSVDLPVKYLARENRLILGLPDATSPESIGINNDQRLLGLAVREITLVRTNSQTTQK